MTGGAGVLQLAFTATARAGAIELHCPRHLRNRAGAVALRAGDRTARGLSRAIACRADLVAGDVELGLRAAYGLPEVDIERVFEVGALLRLLGLLVAAAAEKLRKDIRKSAGSATASGLAS